MTDKIMLEKIIVATVN